MLGFDRGDHAVHLPEYFAILADLVLESRNSDLLCVVSWRGLTNKMIYLNHAEKFPVPKVEFEAGVAYRDVWRRLTSPVLTFVARDTLFLLLHNKLPINERLFRIGLDVDPYFEFCPGGVFCDVEHFFCSCSRVNQVWGWVRTRLLGLLGEGSDQVSNWELINLFFPCSHGENGGSLVQIVCHTIKAFQYIIYIPYVPYIHHTFTTHSPCIHLRDIKNY